MPSDKDGADLERDYDASVVVHGEFSQPMAIEINKQIILGGYINRIG